MKSMKIFLAVLLPAFVATGLVAQTHKATQPDQSAMRLHLPGAITNSLDAIPLGNGLCGGLLWGTVNEAANPSCAKPGSVFNRRIDYWRAHRV